LENITRGGKSTIKKNGSNYCPSSWTDEQIKNRGFTGREDPSYKELCSRKLEWSSVAGKANVKKYGFYGAPGSWSDE